MNRRAWERCALHAAKSNGESCANNRSHYRASGQRTERTWGGMAGGDHFDLRVFGAQAGGKRLQRSIGLFAVSVEDPGRRSGFAVLADAGGVSDVKHIVDQISGAAGR